MPPLMAAYVMKIYNGRQYIYIHTHTLFARLGDFLILVVETGHMSYPANDPLRQVMGK
jgi:ribosomal protein S19